MFEMTERERIQAILLHEPPDRGAVSFWRHFEPRAATGQAAVDAHLGHLARYPIDFLKVMNDHEYPTRLEVRSAQDLRSIPCLRGDEDGFRGQLELIQALAAETAGKIFLVTTIFHSWAVLRRIVTPRTDPRHGPPVLDGPLSPIDQRMEELIAEDRSAVGTALDAIAHSLANFARKCIEAGADGIFLSVREDWVNTDRNGHNSYEELVRTGDGQILSAASEGTFNLLHVCGHPLDFESFAAYPVHAINWADRAAGPSIADVVGEIKPVVCAGVDNLSTLVDGSPDDVAREVRDAVAQARRRPMIVAPGCTFDPDRVPPPNLDAMVRAAHGCRWK